MDDDTAGRTARRRGAQPTGRRRTRRSTRSGGASKPRRSPRRRARRAPGWRVFAGAIAATLVFGVLIGRVDARRATAPAGGRP